MQKQQGQPQHPQSHRPHLKDTYQTVDFYPQGQVVREDDHELRACAYFQVQSKSFSFQGYDHGTTELKSRYNITPKLYRYFNKRHFLFSKFDKGIHIDTESWYSVIPEPVALYLLQRMNQNKVVRVFEPFCGVGGIAVHLAGNFQEYVANDIDADKLDMLESNLQVYGKSPSCLKLINRDFLQVEPFPTDAVIICPPWGGISTEHYASLPLDDIMQPKLTAILKHALKFSQNMLLQMPKHTNIRNLIAALHRTALGSVFTVEKIQTNQRCSQLFFYFGKLAFTGIGMAKLEAALLQGVDTSQKTWRKKWKAFITNQSPQLLVEIYRTRFPNNRVLLL